MNEPLRILIIEDEVLIALSLQIELNRAGFVACGIASRGEEAIQLAAALQPDVVLMDIGLAGQMDGFEAARRILAAQQTHLLFVSGYMDAATLARVREITPLPCLAKPVMIRQLEETLRLVQDQSTQPGDPA